MKIENETIRDISRVMNNSFGEAKCSKKTNGGVSPATQEIAHRRHAIMSALMSDDKSNFSSLEKITSAGHEPVMLSPAM